MTSSSPILARITRSFGSLLGASGVAVFAIRLHHAGAYAVPHGGTLLAAVLALILGGILVAGPTPSRRIGGLMAWAALAASPLVLFPSIYATLAEAEEVVVLKTTERGGHDADLRLWIVDHDGAGWVAMNRAKAPHLDP